MGLKATVDKLTTSTGKFIQSLHSTEYMYLLCEVKEFIRTNQIFLKYRHDSKEFLKRVLVKLVALQISTVSKILKSPLKSAFGISWLWGLRLKELKRQKKNMCQSNSKLGFAHASYCVIKANLTTLHIYHLLQGSLWVFIGKEINLSEYKPHTWY